MWITTNINRYLIEKILDAADTIEYWWVDEMAVVGAKTILSKLIYTLYYLGIVLCAMGMVGVFIAACLGWL